MAKKSFLKLSAVLVVALLWVTSCTEDEKIKVPNEIEWNNDSIIGYGATSVTINFTGENGIDWSANISSGGDWCDFSNGLLAKEGALIGGEGKIIVYLSENTSGKEREAKITVQFEGETSTVITIKQAALIIDNDPKFGYWAELPQHKENEDYVYVAHHAKVGSKTVRNYSICFDEKNNAALWVAYPLHDIYIGGTERTDDWAFDPHVLRSAQPDCTRGSYDGDYDRGHQLPSADRTGSVELNQQTFYMSNITPQINRLNQDMWATLENEIRDNNCSDTLYVVTGTHFGEDIGTTRDDAGNVVPLPSHYYKVLLRSKSGKTGKKITELSANEIIAIGFWVEHRSYGGYAIDDSIITSVDEIEKMTGFDFFSMLSESVATEVETQSKASDWGI